MSVRTLFFAAAVAAVMTWTGNAWADCPAQGSGADGVADWAADNCGDEDGCDNPATTCNGEFTIELLDVISDGPYVTFEYEVCQIGGQNGLSHWIIGLGQITCLAEGATIGDLVVGATLNGEDTDFVVDTKPDPTTEVFGVKFDDLELEDDCNTFAVTFDTGALAEGFTLCVDCTLAATKAGNQDITREDRATPGYACIGGPVCCEDEDETCWKGETAWSAGTRYVTKGNWATFTPYGGEELQVTLYAGQTYEAGTVTFSDPVNGEVVIWIDLNNGFRFADVPENVKIQDYAAAPSGNPNPGGFAHKGDATGSSFWIIVPENNFYGVHVDVERAVPCED